MTIPKINSAHGSETRNIINRAIDLINAQGKSIQDLVAEGQLTPTQYAQLISIVNGNVSKGSITASDIDKNNFKLDQTYMSDSLLQMMAGNTPINAVPSDGSITTVKIANNAVTIDKQEEFLGIAFLNNAYGNLIDFDFVNKRVTIPRYSYITIGSKQLFYNGTEEIIIPYPSGNSQRQLIFDLETKEIKTQLNSLNNPKKSLIIATWWTFDNPNTLVCYSPHSINGEKNTVNKSDIDNVYGNIESATTNMSLDAFKRHSNVGFIGNFEGPPLDFDFVNKRVVVRSGTILTGGGRRIHYNGSSVGDITINFSNLTGQSGERSLIYDLTDDSFKVRRNGETTIPNTLIIATWWSNDDPKSLTCYGKYTINGEEVDGYNNNLSEYVTHSDLNSSDNLIFDEDKHYPLYKSDVYLTEKLKLQFFFDSFFVNIKDNHIKNLNPVLTYNDEIGNSIFKSGLSPVVKGREFSEGDLSIRYQNGELNTHYEKMLNVHFKKHQDITNNSPKILMIGDSQTEHGTPSFTKRALEGIGLTPKMIGTFRDYEGTPSEGRGSWAWSNYIGRNTRVGVNDITITQETGNTSTRTTNPFWKVATADDKANHPDWCFKYNEMNENNLSYTESSDKTGVFYIFDMGFYLPKLEGDIPDVITIGLGGNDLTLDYLWDKDAYEIMDLSLEIMILQIRKELPNTPIVIMPLTARGGFSDENWNPVDNKYVKWYERCASKLKEINDDNTHLLSLFAHMSRDYIWSTEQTVLSNGVLKNVDADKTHFKELGQKQYGEILASCIVNVT